MAVKKLKRKRRIQVDPLELEKRNLRKDIREIYRNAGFEKVFSVSDKEFEFGARTGDVDDVFINKNIVILAEYTCSKESKIGDHLLKKKIIFEKILSDPEGFIEYFEEKFPSFGESRGKSFTIQETKLVIVYASRHKISATHKQHLPNITFFDYPFVKYFKVVSKAIRASSIFELLHFHGIDFEDYGLGRESYDRKVDASLLPESYSNFPKGYKVASFYMDAKSLLERSYVLRNDGWRDDFGTYQRMIVPAKIKEMRRYLHSERRVFTNNIIVTLPEKTKILDSHEDTVDPKKISKIEHVLINIPAGFNTVGLIDGQHRVFCYHEGGEYEESISILRNKQNLLVTGIIYPRTTTPLERMKFEAKLFLEINSTQANAKSDLKQAIELSLKPFSSTSIAKAVINNLNSREPFDGKFEEHFYDVNVVKTTSIVSYGLKPLVKTSGDDSLYYSWKRKDKSRLLDEEDMDLLHEYIQFCASQISIFMSAARSNLPTTLWSADKQLEKKLLTTSIINGFLICFRMMIAGKMPLSDFATYKRQFQGLDKFDFGKYKSSQYAAMARGLFQKFFSADQS